MIGFSVLAYGIGIFLTNNLIGWTLGIVLGTAVAILKLRGMENTLTKAVRMPDDKAKGCSQKHYMFRYLLTGELLGVAAMVSHLSLVGVFIGLLSMKFAAYAQLYNVKKQ